MSEHQGTIVQVMGPVVDVAFPGGGLPALKEALEVELNGRRQVMEVAQHVGGDTVRCIMLSPSEGLGRGMAVTATGAPISVPVGDGVLGRMFNVLGDAIDEKGNILKPMRENRPDASRKTGQEGGSVDDRESGDSKNLKLDSRPLSVDVPLGDGRVAHVDYPSDFTSDEAAKVGAVLGALAN